MRKNPFVNGLAIVIITALVYFLVLRKEIERSKNTEMVTSVNIKPMTTMVKPLRVVGTQLIDSDKVVTRLIGVTTDEFRFYPQKSSIDTLKKNLLEVRSWGVNMVVLYLQQPVKVDKKIDDIVALANWATENGLYTLIFPVVHGDDAIPPENQKLPKEMSVYTPLGKNTEEILHKLSLELKNNVGVLYGMGAEHHNIPQNILYKRQLEMVDTVRRNSPNSVVVINGMEYGHYLELYTLEPPKQMNILYDIHQYVAADGESVDLSKCKVPDQYIGRLPLILGEFGGAYKEGFGSIRDLECIYRFISNADSLGIGYVVHTIDGTSRMGLFDWRNQITSKGKLLKRALEAKLIQQTRLQ